MKHPYTARFITRLFTLLFVATALVATANAQWADLYVYTPEKGDRYEAPAYIGIKYELTQPKELASIGGTVNIEYTTDDGNSWTGIASGIDPFETYYEWYVDANITLSDNYQIRVTEQLPSPKYDPIHFEGWTGPFEIFRSCVPPTIFVQPLTQSACSGNPVTLSVESSAKSATFVWYKNASIIAETRENWLIIYNVSTADEGTYKVDIIEDCGEQATSANASLTVVQSPTITANPPASLVFCDQESTTLSVTATGAGITYQWRHNGVDIPGATSSSIFLDPLTTASNGLYDVVVSGVCTPAVTSTPTSINVITRPVITSDINNLAMCPGASGQLMVSAAGTNLTYEWYRNGVLVASDGTGTLSFTNATKAISGTYRVVVITGGPNPSGCPSSATSSDVQVSVLESPTILRQPTTVDACIDGRTELIVVAEGFALNYQWMKNGAPVPNSNTHALLLENVNPSMAGTYTVRVTGACGLSVTSTPIAVRVIGTPLFVQQPASTTVQLGERIDLSIGATDASNIQWYRNSEPITGATASSYVVESATAAHSGIYTVIVSNTCGSSVSSQARVIVRDPNAQQAILTLAPTTINFGDVPVGYDKVMALTNLITNTGNAPLIVESISSTSTNFSITTAPATPFTLQPNESASVSMRASVASVGVQNGTLTFTSNGIIPVEEAMLAVNGVLYLSHAPSIDYALVPVNTGKEMCVPVMNTSGATITVDQLNITGVDAAMFSIITATPLDVPAGESRDICVRFAPTASGARTAQIAIISSTAGNSTLTLQGVGDDVSDVADDAASVMSIQPNPTSGHLTLRLTEFPATQIDIVSVSGAVIRTLQTAGTAGDVITWDGLDAGGSPAASGAYLVVVHGVSRVISMPLSIIR